MATNVNPGNNMWQGGALHRLAPPTAQSGGIAGPNTTVSSPVGGVNPGAPFFARPNTGSNIRVPYSRLCPLSSELGGGLPDGPLADDAQWGTSKDYPLASDTGLRKRGRIKTETEDLHASRIAFILGKRSKMGDLTGDVNNDFPLLDSYGINTQLSTGVGSVHRMQKLCSMEYLERYFTNRLLAGKHIELSAVFGADVDGWTSGLLKALRLEAKATPVDLTTKSMMDSGDLCTLLAGKDSVAAGQGEILQGIFTNGDGPFLHGMPTKHKLVESRAAGDVPDGHEPGNEFGGRRRFPFQCDRARGNMAAFAALCKKFEDIGLMDWTPDGIVLSKGTNDPSDKLNDEFVEARDGALFNVVMQGPTISTSWSGKKELAVLPMDKVFVVIIADLWRLAATDLDTPEKKATYAPVTDGTRWNLDKANKYKELLDKQRDVTPNANQKLDSKPLNVDANKKVYLTNFRVRVSTSAEMVTYSNLKFHDGKVVEGSRMGLRHTPKMSEYIVGGWHLGNVMDSAASRRAMPGTGNITMRTAPNTMAHNINVNISWWSADQMWEAFMNKEGSLRARYEMEKDALAHDENIPQ